MTTVTHNGESIGPKPSACPFCDLVRRNAYADEGNGIASFEPLNPVTSGHMLFIPVEHVADATASLVWAGETMRAAARYVAYKRITANIITSIGAVATQSVMHLHVHVVPRTEGDGLTLPWTGQVKP